MVSLLPPVLTMPSVSVSEPVSVRLLAMLMPLALLTTSGAPISKPSGAVSVWRAVPFRFTLPVPLILPLPSTVMSLLARMPELTVSCASPFTVSVP